MHRPNSLFSDEEVQDGGLYLQDLSDGKSISHELLVTNSTSVVEV